MHACTHVPLYVFECYGVCSYDAYKARCQLAALDHNQHIGREIDVVRSTREQKFHRKYNKNSQQWTVKNVKKKCKCEPRWKHRFHNIVNNIKNKLHY